MECPVCHVALQLTERQGVEIDYCPQCRGVWLDRGEIDKLIERSESYQAAWAPVARDRLEREASWQRHHDAAHSHSPRKHRSFLGEIFDLG